MIAITSLSPTHINSGIQQKAIDSWLKLGLKCYSFNKVSEIEMLSNKFTGIQFVPTTKTMEASFGKPYVSISAMIDWAKEQDCEEFCFINSDIELGYDVKLLGRIKSRMFTSVVISNRFDYDKKKVNTVQYLAGIDAFFLSKKHLSIYPPSLFCMGQCFWDYYIPYVALKNNIEVVMMQNEFVFHKKHPVQYSHDNWEKTALLFIIENNIVVKDPGKMRDLVFNFLNLMVKKIKL